MKARLNYAKTAASVYLARMLVLRERAALAWTEAVTLTINDHVDL